MPHYRCLGKNIFTSGNYSLVPIRMEDRHEIMRWRNEQIYHLRQKEFLTENEQDKYFKEVVFNLFDSVRPNQTLFSFLEDHKLIGYGGLVHINWEDKNAEVSFLIKTELEKENVNRFWFHYLQLLDKVAFEELRLHKIYTYAFDLRPHLYKIFEDSGFLKEATLKEHVLFEGNFIDVIIHSKIK
jgi:RimJ/RimL family protein N-acetyltransferase